MLTWKLFTVVKPLLLAVVSFVKAQSVVVLSVTVLLFAKVAYAIAVFALFWALGAPKRVTAPKRVIDRLLSATNAGLDVKISIPTSTILCQGLQHMIGGRP